jgi:ubiquinone/menaquinone biosynthesis C-methylase UbiE
MRRLVGVQEHLDGPLDRETLAGNLRDLARINRWLGGVALSRAAVGALARGPERDPRAPLTILDVGTGGADIPAALLRGPGGRLLRITATDARPEIVEAARKLRGPLPGLTLQVADGTALPWPDRAFDVVHASMVLHHLDPPAATAMLRELGRVAERGVVVNDLDRDPIVWLGAWLLVHAITGNRYTRNDGPLSVRRAYRPADVRRMAASAGLRERGRWGAPGRYAFALVADERS